jgi:hypothetical protein
VVANTLVSPAELTDYPGAPFADAIVDGAVAWLRREVGWHIAPVVEETLTLDSLGGRTLILPTRKIVQVTQVRDVSDAATVVLTGWRKSSKAGLLHRWCGWPRGFESVEVDLEHGFAETPKELLAVIVELCQSGMVNSRVSQESAGGESVSLRTGGALGVESASVLDGLTVHAGF